MRKAAEGAFAHGARTLSLLPVGRYDDAHPFTDLALRTGLTEPYRNVLLGSIADAAVILPGSHGTLQEAMVLLDADVPIVAVGDHFGWLTDDLPVPHDLDPAAAVGLLAEALGLALPTP